MHVGPIHTVLLSLVTTLRAQHMAALCSDKTRVRGEGAQVKDPTLDDGEGGGLVHGEGNAAGGGGAELVGDGGDGVADPGADGRVAGLVDGQVVGAGEEECGGRVEAAVVEEGVDGDGEERGEGGDEG